MDGSRYLEEHVYSFVDRTQWEIAMHMLRGWVKFLKYMGLYSTADE